MGGGKRTCVKKNIIYSNTVSKLCNNHFLCNFIFFHCPIKGVFFFAVRVSVFRCLDKCQPYYAKEKEILDPSLRIFCFIFDGESRSQSNVISLDTGRIADA